MTEAAFFKRLAPAFKAADPTLEWTKHADGSTKGIPDASIAVWGRTAWLEGKVIRPGDDPFSKRHIEPVQLVKMLRLDVATLGLAWYVFWRLDGEPRTEFYTPDRVAWKGRPTTVRPGYNPSEVVEFFLKRIREAK